MKRCAFLFTVLLYCSAAASDTPTRPRILGIYQVRILATNRLASLEFYSKMFFDLGHQIDRTPRGQIFVLNFDQDLSINQAPAPVPANLLDEITFTTDDVPALRKYLAFRQRALSDPAAPPLADHYLTVADPEGHHIGFIQEGEGPGRGLDRLAHWRPLRLIHAGFIVHDRAATEHFYKDILAFHPYWHGGMKDDQTDWVSMQVPDGTDWLEFMVNVRPDPDQRLRGIMNHIAIGVPDIHAAEKKLQENGVKLNEEPKIGRDGKWQLNLYDPDLTRIEFMEFTPVQRPCCSEFTGPHPGPQPPPKAPAKP